ncbi:MULTISPECIES: SIS domain-containing protein [Streptomyces]|uniref:Bifunctional glucose-6-phosphate/mannose-6-phosphate isomerase n=1 Tax=Streptomyces lasiicapitis TaxID=1923961 RepID=A0ABQ2MQW3_9ACTN|nr:MULTISPECIES: SIS domain-containing protein [Streptomyces]QIB45435.1 mannose-6-phosphate isomerase [Streptomyces aureoverticillatus]GGO56289.1 bifunctional glucose-6-phosphate/mannose-6-phosphate isomerase [Streptomyces lasiicapitis]
MLDESLLDAPEALARADLHDLLRGAAEAGARVRTAVRHATESGLTELKPDGRPRAVLIAGPGTAATGVADLIGTLAGTACPVVRLAPTGVAPAAGALRWALPGWTGPVDLLLIVTPDGSEPGLTLLAEQAYRRGCTVVAVAPPRSPLAESVEGSHGLTVPMAASPVAYEAAQREPFTQEDLSREAPATAPGTLWALLTPLLVLLDRTGLIAAPVDTLQKVADRLDSVAERCGPAIATYSNPAKTLATELSETLPLIWSEGQSAGMAGRRFAAALAELAGHAALAAELPEALAAHTTLLAGGPVGGGDGDDFFRDRVEEPASLRARVVLLREHPADAGGLTAAPTARELVHSHDTALSELEPADGGDLERLAELIAITDFAAVYLALASGDRS